MENSIIILGHSEIFLRSDYIIQVNASDHTYSAADIKSIHEAVHKISDSKKAFLLLIASDYTSVDTEARKYLSTPEAGLYSIAEAYVIKSLAQRLLMNFFINVQGTPVPVKFFTEMEAAEKWLKKFQQDQLNT